MHRRDFLRPGTKRQAPAPRTAEGVPASAATAVESRVRSRRGFLQIVSGVVLSSLTGCATWRLGKQRCELSPDLPMTDLVAHLNANIDQINAWNCNHVKIGLQGAAMAMPSVSARMTVERPRNFRLKAEALGQDVVDLGSNQERFWFWMKGEDGILTARHDQLAAAQKQLPLPFEPDWLIEALGVIPLDENEIEFEKHPTEPKQVFFRRQRQAPDGSPVELVSTVDTCQGVIVEHSLVNRRGTIIALAKMGEHERNKEVRSAWSGQPREDGPDLVLPHQVVLSWPQAKLGLTIRMGAIEINPESIPEQMFVMSDRNGRVYDIGGNGGATVEQVVDEEPEPRMRRRGKARL